MTEQEKIIAKTGRELAKRAMHTLYIVSYLNIVNMGFVEPLSYLQWRRLLRGLSKKSSA